MEDKLVEVSVDDLPKLMEMYKVDWPNNIIPYYTLETYHKWAVEKLNLSFNIYCLNGNWKQDGTFVIIRNDGNSINCNTLQESCENLKRLLNLIDLSKGYFILCYHERFRSAIFETLAGQKCTTGVDDCTYFYYKPKEEILEMVKSMKVPDGMKFGPLEEKHVPQINDIWLHKFKGSEKYIEFLRISNYNVGLFDTDGELVAWCLRIESGALAALQVEEKHYRKGYGTLVALELSRQLAELGYDITANVIEHNTKSINLFEKLKFKRLFRTHWLGVGDYLK